MIMAEPAWALPSGWLVAYVDIVWAIYIVLFRKMGFGHQEDVYFVGVEKYFYFFYALGQPICIPRCYVVCVYYFTNLLSMVGTQ
jgi:hypothetical protein